MTLSLTNNQVNWPEAKQLQWEINCKCYPDSVQPEQEHLRVFSGALGDSAVRKRQEDNARHYTLTADKARFRTLNWKQDRCHSFPEQDPRNGCIWKTLWLETLPRVQRFVGFASPIKETFAKPSPTVSHGHGLIVHVQRVLVLCQAVRSDFQPYFTTVKGGAREGGLNSLIPLDSITFWHGCIP